MVIAYVDRGGVPFPQSLPDRCPHDDCVGEHGRVRAHSWRSRATGPKHRLLVMCCSVHKFFTIYPPGFAPHQRKPLAQTAYGNSTLVGKHWPQKACKDSLFQAALDASEGKTWLRKWVESPRLWWETQRRETLKAGTLLGLAPDMAQAEILAMANILDLDYLLIAQAREKIREKPGYRCRGQAVSSVLMVLMNKSGPLERLLLAGHHRGLWGKPLWWDADSKIIRENPFRIAGLES